MKKQLIVTSTTGERFLLQQKEAIELIEDNDSTPYKAPRASVKLAFCGHKEMYYEFHFTEKIVGAMAEVQHFPVERRIIIGCQEFVGADYTKLFNWANVKKF